MGHYTFFFLCQICVCVQFSILYRYELPGVCGLNFVLRKSLGGGGISSLRSDPQVRHITVSIATIINSLG